MPKYVAFLRAINVGGHVVKMDQLRKLFTAMGFSGVETFIASGNVIFDSPAKNTRTLEKKIEDNLQKSLGYRVDAFVRSISELAAIACYKPFDDAEVNTQGHTLFVVFVGAEPSAQATKTLLGGSAVDVFHCQGREVYWLRRGKFLESEFSGPLLEKTLAMPATVRNANTVKRIAAKYS
jgi:uncharacterized protein (DUF1697 family)